MSFSNRIRMRILQIGQGEALAPCRPHENATCKTKSQEPGIVSIEYCAATSFKTKHRDQMKQRREIASGVEIS